MINTYEKFKMMDQNKNHDFFIEVNYNLKDETTNECKILKVTFPNNDICYLDKKHLNEVLFAIGASAEQQKMIPQKITHVKWYETVLSIKATKDIKKGEQITFPIKLSLPKVEEEIIGEAKEIIKKRGILVPQKQLYGKT